MEVILALLNKCIADESIDYIIPAQDDVHLALSKHQADINAVCITQTYAINKICRYKSITYEVVRVPEVYPTPAAVTSF